MIDDLRVADLYASQLGSNINRTMIAMIPKCEANDNFLSGDPFYKLNSEDLKDEFYKEYPFVSLIQIQLNYLVLEDSNSFITEEIINILTEDLFKDAAAKPLFLQTVGWQHLMIFVFYKTHSDIYNIIVRLRSYTVSSLCKDKSKEKIRDHLIKKDNYLKLLWPDLLHMQEREEILNKIAGSNAFLWTLQDVGHCESLNCLFDCQTRDCLNNEELTAKEKENCKKKQLKLPVHDTQITYTLKIKANPGHCLNVKNKLEKKLISEFAKEDVWFIADISAGEFTALINIKEKEIPSLWQTFLLTMSDYTVQNDLSRNLTYVQVSNFLSSICTDVAHNTTDKPTLAYNQNYISRISDHFKNRMWNQLIAKTLKLHLPRVLRDSVHNTILNFFTMLSDPELFYSLIDLFPSFNLFYKKLTELDTSKGIILNEPITESIRNILELLNRAVFYSTQNSIKVSKSLNIVPESKIDLSSCVSMINGLVHAVYEIAGDQDEAYSNSVTLISNSATLKASNAWGCHFIKLNTQNIYALETSLPCVYHEVFHFLMNSFWLEKPATEFHLATNILRTAPLNETDRIKLIAYYEIIKDLPPHYFQTLFMFNGDIEKAIQFIFVYQETYADKSASDYGSAIVPSFLIGLYLLKKLHDKIEEVFKTPTIQGNEDIMADDVLYDLFYLQENAEYYNDNRLDPIVNKIFTVNFPRMHEREEKGLKNTCSSFYKEVTMLLQRNKRFIPSLAEKWASDNTIIENTISLLIPFLRLDREVGELMIREIDDNVHEYESAEIIKRRKINGLSSMVWMMVLIRYRFDDYNSHNNKSGIKKKEEIKKFITEQNEAVPYTPAENVPFEAIRYSSTILNSLWEWVMESVNDNNIVYIDRNQHGTVELNKQIGDYCFDRTLGGAFSLTPEFRERLLGARMAGLSSVLNFSSFSKSESIEKLSLALSI